MAKSRGLTDKLFDQIAAPVGDQVVKTLDRGINYAQQKVNSGLNKVEKTVNSKLGKGNVAKSSTPPVKSTSTPKTKDGVKTLNLFGD